MDKRTMMAIGIIGSAAFGWWWFKVRGQATEKKSTDAAQDQSLAMQEQANYTQPPSVGFPNYTGQVVTNMDGVTNVNSRQTMPLPYNT